MEPLIKTFEPPGPPEAARLGLKALFSMKIRLALAAFRFYRMRAWWIRRSLFQQFAMTSSVVLTLSVIAVGGWIGARIAENVLHTTSGAAALYMTNFVEPYVQSMAGGDLPSQDDVRRLDVASELLKSRRHVVSVKIWRPDGTIVYSTQKNLIGRRFPTNDILPSLQGNIRAGMADLSDDDSEFERSLSMPLYEVFIPLYRNETESIIAVAEIYEDAGRLIHDQANAVIGAWAVVGLAGAATLLVLFAIVYRGSMTIDKQRAAIKLRFRETIQLHRRNDILKSETEAALRTVAHIDDLIHARLGAELHDGPVQLVSFVLLRLEGLKHDAEILPLHQQLRSSLQSALNELRAIAAGLLLPDPGEASNLSEVIRGIIQTHESRTGCDVEYEEDCAPNKLPGELVRCAARVTQEALTNAYKHSGSRRQAVILSLSDGVLRLLVRDNGCGIDGARPPAPNSGLGMQGMASRIRAVGGSFSVLSEKRLGTEIVCEIPVTAGTEL